MSVFLTHGRQPHFSFLKKEHGAEGAATSDKQARKKEQRSSDKQEAWAGGLGTLLQVCQHVGHRLQEAAG